MTFLKSPLARVNGLFVLVFGNEGIKEDSSSYYDRKEGYG